MGEVESSFLGNSLEDPWVSPSFFHLLVMMFFHLVQLMPNVSDD